MVFVLVMPLYTSYPLQPQLLTLKHRFCLLCRACTEGTGKVWEIKPEITEETLTDTHDSKIQLHLLDKLSDPEGKTFWFEFFDNPILIAAPC